MTEEADLKRPRTLIANRMGLLVREQDDDVLRKALAERVKALNLSSVEQYCRFLDTEPDISREREELVILLTAGETYFFRDSGLHTLLQSRILPELLERCRETGDALRIWSAACSSGEEAYSLAILLDELTGEQLPRNVFILGTDINHHAIEKAQRGIYTDWSFRGMSDARRQRYFHRQKDTWVLDDSIRRKVTFQTGDLVGDTFPDHAAELYDMDLILCRNTFIYMAPHVISHILDKFSETLKVGGMLITGHGELYAHHLGQLRTRLFPESIAYQKVVAPFYAPTLAPGTAPLRPPTPKPATVLPAGSTGQVVTPTPLSRREIPARDEEQRSELLQAWQQANQGQRELAATSCREMISRNPLDADPHYLMALLAQEREDFAAAKDMLKKVIYLDPLFIAAYLDLGDLYAREGEDARAAKMRSAASVLLKSLPGDAQVKLFGASTANEVLQYVEHQLNINSQ